MISIVTPTYNRDSMLYKLYDSLDKQTLIDFEWIIVDDGSIDGTEKVVKDIKSTCSKFPIIYIKKENGGKHTALNEAMQYVKGDYVFIVDSDDYISQDAIESVISWCKEVDERKEVAGVAGLRAYQTGEIIGGNGDETKEYIEAKNTERKKYNLLGDKAEVYKTEILKKYPFPVFEKEKFLSEAVVWNAIARDGYLIRWYCKPIYYTEYLKGGLTYAVKHKNIEFQNFEGYSYATKIDIMSYPSIKTKSMIFIKYYKMAKKRKINFKRVCKKLDINFLEGSIYWMLGQCGCAVLSIVQREEE